MGFCMYGAISLIGTVAIEKAPVRITGAAHAVIGLAANCMYCMYIALFYSLPSVSFGQINYHNFVPM